jgi:hypothetical protein
MTDLELETELKGFRAGAAAPSPEARATARGRLLAAVAGAGEASGPAVSRRRPLVGRLAVIVALALGIGVAALASGTLHGDAPGVIERAEAALSGGDRILHVVVRISDSSGTTREEAWVRTDGSGGHSVSLSGEPRSDCVSTKTQQRCYDAARNVTDIYTYFPDAVREGEHRNLPGYRADDPASLSLALGSGYARALSDTVVDGRSVHAIELAVPWIAADGTATPRFSASSPILYVDRETYLPVAERFRSESSTTTYETYEFLPDDAGHARLLDLGAPSDAKVVRHPLGEGPSS